MAMMATGMLTQKDGPPCVLGEPAAEDRADRGEPPADAEEDGQRLAPLAECEGGHDDGQRGREQEGGADAL
jgi:hypothetical protein